VKFSAGLFAAFVLLLVGGAAAVAGTYGPSARVVGRVELCGGKAPGGCRSANARVTVKDASGLRVATHRTEQARFEFSLTPGRYTLRAVISGDQTSRWVVAVANETTHANLVFELK
jgi:hypothetical protein